MEEQYPFHRFRLICAGCEGNTSPMATAFDQHGNVRLAGWCMKCGFTSYLMMSFEKIVANCHELDKEQMKLAAEKVRSQEGGSKFDPLL